MVLVGQIVKDDSRCAVTIEPNAEEVCQGPVAA